jgi:hypothetical protein
MKKYMVLLPLSAMTLFVSLPAGANAQVAVVEVIKAGVKKVIKAIDLKVQRMQNKTIWLQNAQKALENQLSKLKLAEIAGWTEKQKELYSGYYRELWTVKSAIAYYQRVRELADKQAVILEEYRRARELFGRDAHFRPEELEHMQEVYRGILDESLQNVDMILLVVHSYRTQMSDAERLKIVNEAADRMETNYSDLKQFNRQNCILSLQRAKSLEDAAKLKALYGLE